MTQRVRDCQDKTFLYQKLTLKIDSIRAGNIRESDPACLQHLPQDVGRLLNDLDITVLIHGIKSVPEPVPEAVHFGGD